MTNDGATYDRYAALYDALGQGRWGAALARFALDTILPVHGPAPRTALDLACGTGAAALVLADAGLATVGLDCTWAMLRCARDKARRAHLPICLVRADLRAFAFARPFDLIACCYDSLNYLTAPTDLAAALRCVRAALAPGGLLVCDLTTRHAYTGELDGVQHELELDDLALRWRTAWDASSALATTTLELRLDGGGDGWHAECHVQRAYAPVEVAGALRQAGLRLLTTHGTAADTPLPTPPDPAAPRVVYVATPAN